MMDGMMNCCGGMVGFWLVVLLLLAILVGAAVYTMTRRSTR